MQLYSYNRAVLFVDSEGALYIEKDCFQQELAIVFQPRVSYFFQLEQMC